MGTSTAARLTRMAAALASSFACASACSVEGPLLTLRSFPPVSAEPAPIFLPDAAVSDAQDPPEMNASDASLPRLSLAAFTRDNSVSVGLHHACALRERRLWCWGAIVNSTRPVAVSPEQEFVNHSAGSDYHCALSAAQRMSCFGQNEWGKLGTRDRTPRTSLTEVTLPGTPVELSAGEGTTCALLDDHGLWCWGRGEESELGIPGRPGFGSEEPVPVAAGAAWQDIEVGWGHVCATQVPGSLWCWGRDTQGQVGVDGPEEQYLEPTRVGVEEEWQMLSAGMMNTCGIDREAQLRCWGELNGVTTPLPQVVLGDQAIARVTTDTFHRCAVNTSGELYCWGRGIEGQLGTGDFMRHDIPVAIVTPLPVEDVSVGRFQTCILLQDHTVWCAGANEDGQIGLGDMERRSEFTRLEFAQ